MKGLTDIDGIRVGHAWDREGRTGCTVVLCESGAVGGVDIRGSATGTEEMDALNPLHVTPAVHAVVFAGGSAFGLEAASGVRKFLARKGVGFAITGGPVPIVPCAILYDLAFAKPGVRPTREMGEAAAAAATSQPVEEGALGAGAGATVGKILGLKHAMKSGIGSATVSLEGAQSGVRVAALAAVNAWGDVRDPRSRRIIAGARRTAESLEFLDTEQYMKRATPPAPARENTTLVVVATNARLTRLEATKLAQFGQHGLVRAISPAHTTHDGDLVIALSLGAERASIDALGVAAAEAVAQAIVRAVELAPSMGGLPGLHR